MNNSWKPTSTPSRGSKQADPCEGSRLLTITDVAQVLGTTPKQIRNMVGRGQLPAPLKIPGLGLRWHQGAVDTWLANLYSKNGLTRGEVSP